MPDTKLFVVLNDPSVHNFTKQIIRDGLTKDPVDAVSDVETALEVLKEVMNERLGIKDKSIFPWRNEVVYIVGNPPTVAKPSNPANKPLTHD
jgi:hypothetical protein